MKKTIFTIAIFGALLFTASVGYAETKSPVKQQTEMFVQSCNLP